MVRISSTFSVLRPLYFDLFTSNSLVRLAYFDLGTSTFCQIWTSYWSRRTGQSTVLVDVKSKMVEVQKRSNWCAPIKKRNDLYRINRYAFLWGRISYKLYVSTVFISPWLFISYNYTISPSLVSFRTFSILFLPISISQFCIIFYFGPYLQNYVNYNNVQNGGIYIYIISL